jgi:holo-[acyl-carrier protein] synthase
MIKGIGTDVCRISRVEAVLEKFGEKFLARVLTEKERHSKRWDARHLARRWAIKEAVTKALGTGIGATVGWHDIEVVYSPKGQPLCRVKGYEALTIWVTTSDDSDYAVAMAVAESQN